METTSTSGDNNIVDVSINFTLRGLDTGVNLFERINFGDISGDVIYHHFIAKKQIVAASFDFVFWFRCPSGSFLLDDLLDENKYDTEYAINSENWNVVLSYSDFIPDSGIDLCYNVIGEHIDCYYDKRTIASIGVNRLAKQVSNTYMSSYVFANKDEIIQNYIELDASINDSVLSKLDYGGSFSYPLMNSSDKDKNISRCLLETMLSSESNKKRIEDSIEKSMNETNTGQDVGYPWVPLKFLRGDKIRHRLTYNVANIVIDYSNNNVIDTINGMSSEQYPDIIAGGRYIDMSNVVITDQHFLIEYEMI
tara:strand:+ start:4495 stop:5418 length:924 start_codon:yes stop_codon:yes gene_type:complete